MTFYKEIHTMAGDPHIRVPKQQRNCYYRNKTWEQDISINREFDAIALKPSEMGFAK